MRFPINLFTEIVVLASKVNCPSLQPYRVINTARIVCVSQQDKTVEMEKIKGNPYFGKYAEKIAKLQRTSPEEFLNRIEAFEKGKNMKEVQVMERGFSNASSLPNKPSTALSYTKEEKLDTIMKFDLIKDKSAEEIIKASTYSTISANAQEYPMFLYPLPREQGYEFFVAQFSGHGCHFTSLINYQVHKENAPECLTITHYTELEESKGIVLMRGEYNKDILSGSDARCLANQLQLYYASAAEGQRRNLLITFTRNPNNFKHMELIDQLNNFTL